METELPGENHYINRGSQFRSTDTIQNIVSEWLINCCKGGKT